MKSWRPDGWVERYNEAYMKEHSSKVTYPSPERAMFEAGADALWEALMKHRVKMPPDFTPILIVLPSEITE